MTGERAEIKLCLVPGGILPRRQTRGAIGYDAHIRAIVSATDMDLKNPHLRKTLFDFKNLPCDPEIALNVVSIPVNGGRGTELAYRLDPAESVLAGIGFMTAMPFPLMYWVAPRSGLASKHKIQVGNAPGTVDPDYRGEAGVLVCNRSEIPFYLRYGMRIAQVIFQWAVIPDIVVVQDRQELEHTDREAGGFGSTGM